MMKNIEKHRKLFLSMGIILFIAFFSINFGTIFGLGSETIPEEYQSRLKYDVLNWEDANGLGVSWTLYEAWPGTDTVYKGNVSTNVGGIISVNFTSYDVKNSTFESYENLNYVPYGDIAFFKKLGMNYIANMSLTNVSMNEIGMIIMLGYMGWDPAFQVSTDWKANSILALSKADTGYTTAEVMITNATGTVTYSFKQLTPIGPKQTTILTYDKHTGILLEAQTEFSQYKCHIRLQGYVPLSGAPQIPGYSIFVLIGCVIGGIVLIKTRSKRN
jgi:hypothetical protein